MFEWWIEVINLVGAKKHRPKRLYKYATPDRVDVLEGLKIRFTQAATLNDPFECSPAFSDFFPSDEMEAAGRRDGDAVIKYYPGSPEMMARFERFSPAQRAEINKLMVAIGGGLFKTNILILCLSDQSDSLAMWAHYTNNHQGLVIGFDAQHPFILGDRKTYQGLDLAAANRVRYTRHRPHFKFITEISKTAAYFTKSPEWRYEREWRMLRSIADEHELIGDGIEDIYLFALPPACIRCVILGADASDELQARVKRALHHNNALHHVELLKAEIDKHSFKLRTRTIDYS